MHSVHYSQKAEEGGKNGNAFSAKIELATRAGEGDEQALAELIRTYAPVIRRIAFRYKRDLVTLDELIHEGKLAMWQRVALKYDPEKAGNFDAFVSRCLHSAIFDYVNRMRRQPLNRSLIAARNYLLEEMRRYELELGRPMTEEELVEYMNRDSGRKHDIESVRRILRYNLPNTHTSSLSEPCFEDGDETKADRLLCTNPLPDAQLEAGQIKKLVRERVDTALNGMSERNKSMIKMRLGLTKNHREMTLRELGEIHGLTRERVRQIENTGRKRLKAKLRYDPILQEAI